MGFVPRVIDGGLSETKAGVALATRQAVRAETVRRIRKASADPAYVRHLAEGTPLPPGMRYLRMQIEFVGEKLMALDPIPEDYADDVYWPA